MNIAARKSVGQRGGWRTRSAHGYANVLCAIARCADRSVAVVEKVCGFRRPGRVTGFCAKYSREMDESNSLEISTVRAACGLPAQQVVLEPFTAEAAPTKI